MGNTGRTVVVMPEQGPDCHCPDGCLCLDEPMELVAIGADPEFELVNSAGRVVAACSLIADPGNENRIGLDQAGYQIEFRPKPGRTPEELVANLGKLFAKFSELFNGYRLSARGNVFAIGGHIHFGLSRPISECEADVIARAVDSVIGECVERSGTARGEYRVRAAWRRQPHGLEHRTPPAGIWASPVLALAVLKIAWYVVDELCRTGRFVPAEFSIDRVGLSEEEKRVWEEFLAGGVRTGNVLDAWLGSGPRSWCEFASASAGIAEEDDDLRLVELVTEEASDLQYVTCELPAITRDNELCFIVWPGKPDRFIPARMAANYVPTDRGTYLVTLWFRDTVIMALEGQREPLWDPLNNRPIPADSSDLAGAIDPLAAQFWCIWEYHIRRMMR